LLLGVIVRNVMEITINGMHHWHMLTACIYVSYWYTYDVKYIIW